MTKTMAVVDGDTVINIIWCDAMQPETNTWKDPMDRPIRIGDTYSDGKWYRDGVEILTPLEEAQKELEDLQSQLFEMDVAYREGVNSV